MTPHEEDFHRFLEAIGGSSTEEQEGGAFTLLSPMLVETAKHAEVAGSALVAAAAQPHGNPPQPSAQAPQRLPHLRLSVRWQVLPLTIKPMRSG